MHRRTRRRSIAAAAALLSLMLPAVASASATPPVTAALAAATSAQPGAQPTSATPATSEHLITADEATAKVKQYFEIPEGRGRLETHLSTQNGHQTWQIMYAVTNGNATSSYGLGAVDAVTGQILNFSLSGADLRPIRTGPLGPGQPRRNAELKAWALVQEMYPEAVGSLVPMPDNLGIPAPYFGNPNEYGVYNFAWVQQHGGVPVPANTIRVSVDMDSLAYVTLSANLQENLNFAPDKPALTADEALAKFKQNLNPKLAYQPYSSPYPYKEVYLTEGSELKLVYQVVNAAMVDALTGQPYRPYYQETAPATVPEAVPPTPPSVTKLAPPVKLPLDETSAVAYARALINPPADAQVNVSPRGAYPYDNNMLQVNFWSSSANIGVTLDQKTGRVINIYRNAIQPAPSPGQRPAPPGQLSGEQRNQAKKAAILTVQQFYSDLTGELKLEQPPLPYPQPNSFYFQRYEHDLPVTNNGITVTIDPETMAWSNLSFSWSQEPTVPDPAKALKADEIAQQIVSQVEPVLTYQVKPTRPEPGRPPAPTGQPQEAVLVYQMVPRDGQPWIGILDATTGQPLLYGADGRTPAAEVDRLLTGHWAEGEMRFLYSRGVLPVNHLDPNGTISRFEAVSLLQNAPQWHGGIIPGFAPDLPYQDVPKGSPMYQMMAAAYLSGFLSPDAAATFAGDQPVTRADFALWMARSLGLGRLARSSLSTNSGFGDLSSLTGEQRNAAAFLEALGILKPAPRFRGSDPLTQAEASAMIVRMLNLTRNP